MGGFVVPAGGAGLRSIVQLWFPNAGGVAIFGICLRWIEISVTVAGAAIFARDDTPRGTLQTRADWCEFMEVVLAIPPSGQIRTDNGAALPATMTEIFSTPTILPNTPLRIDGPWRSNDSILSGFSIYPDADNVGISATFAWNETFAPLGG
jgi:hypothetical protein